MGAFIAEGRRYESSNVVESLTFLSYGSTADKKAVDGGRGD